MATEASTNGSGALTSDNLSIAEQMQKKHAEAHNPTIEEVVDEEDIQHPPPSAAQASAAGQNEIPLSEKAMGKQKAEPEPEAKPKGQIIDTSLESFPTLGSGPKPRAPGAVPAAWGAKKPTLVANGVNGSGHSSSGPTSRVSTPASGMRTPALGQSRIVNMPGRQSETVTFATSQLKPKEELDKPIPQMLKDINKKSKATVELKPAPNGGLAFESIGPSREVVQQALREVARQIGAEQSIEIPIPASVRSHIIGRQGATIQEIGKKSGAKIQVPKAEETFQPLDEDDDFIIDVSVVGDPIAAEIARREIEAIVKDRTSTMNTRLREIPAELYPFLAGPFNSNLERFAKGDVQVKVPPYQNWSRQTTPSFDEKTQRPVFAPHPTSHISLSGDREAVQRAKTDFERRAHALRQQIAMKQLPIDKNRHQFIMNDDESLHSFLDKTGCYVVIPSDSDETELVTLVGPQGKLDEAEASVVELAMSMQSTLIDIAKLHNKAPQDPQAHARALTNYLRQRKAIAELEKMYGSRIVLPTAVDGPTHWEVYSRDGPSGYRAKTDITNIVNAHPPSKFRHVEMDPFYHQHVRENYQQQLLQDHGVHLILPDESEEDPQVIMVYEGPSQPGAPFEIARQRPSQADAARFEEALRQAQHIIQGLSQGQRPIESRPVEIPSKYHDKIHKFVHKEQQGIPEGVFPVQFLARGSALPTGRREPIIRGPNDTLDPLLEKIHAFVEAEKQDELERGHVISFDFPKKHANILIGKRGENINKLREEFDVDIQVSEGKVDIKGPPKKAAAAKSRILAMGKKLDDEATHILKIDPQYHRELIGARGSQVNRLQDRYNVRVQFPRSAQNHDDDVSLANGSEAGGPRTPRSNQAPNEVIVRGPKKGADAAKEELESLLKWTVENSHTSTVSVAQNQLPSLIGAGGREMENIRQITGAKIDVPPRDAASPTGRVELRIKGTKKQVDDAKKLLQEKAKVFDDITSKVINVDKKHHRAIIGPQGSNLRKVVLAAGGPSNEREQNRIVKVPKADSNDTAIRIEGNKAMVDKIVIEIQKIVSDRENQTTDVVEVSPEKHRHLIGPGGRTRRNLELELGVNIEIPKESVQGPARSQVKLSGSPDKVAAAKEHISGMFKTVEGETILVPRALHHTIADNGRFFVSLRNDHRVTVDHAGEKPPPKTSPKPTADAKAPLPLITDEDTAENHSWSIAEGGQGSNAVGDIPWILRGSPEDVAKAKILIQKALNNANSPACTGYLTLADPSNYRRIIGTGGSNINAIRNETDCKINVPRNQARGEAIEIVGSKEGVERAKDMILESIEERE